MEEGGVWSEMSSVVRLERAARRVARRRKNDTVVVMLGTDVEDPDWGVAHFPLAVPLQTKSPLASSVRGYSEWHSRRLKQLTSMYRAPDSFQAQLGRDIGVIGTE